MNSIVVGVDESPGATNALRWAHAHGRQRRQPVTALMAWDYLDQRHVDPGAPFDPEYSQDAADKVLSELVDQALGPDHGVACVTALEHPRTALVEASESAELVVVGARGLGGFRSLLLGSVSRHVLHNAYCPVAVIRGGAHHVDGPIVVGVDGSEQAQRALAWATELGAAIGQRVLAVYAWHPTALGGPLFLVIPDMEGLEKVATDTLNEAITSVAVPDAAIEPRLARGRPAAEILAAAAAEGAGLIVVGARGTSGLRGDVLGSVSDQVVHHAELPVIVVP